jgi:hypothetical protein
VADSASIVLASFKPIVVLFIPRRAIVRKGVQDFGRKVSVFYDDGTSETVEALAYEAWEKATRRTR